MSDTAKIFVTGRSQADRLPMQYRFDCNEVFIRRNPRRETYYFLDAPTHGMVSLHRPKQTMFQLTL